MKKFFSLLLAGSLLFSLVACNKIDNPSPNPNPGGPPPAAQDNQDNQGNQPKPAEDNEPDEEIVPQAGCTVIKIGKKAYTIHKENATMNDWFAEYGEKEGWHSAYDSIFSPNGSQKIDFDNAKRDEALKTGDTFKLLAEQMPPRDDSPEGIKKAAEAAANANTATATPEAQPPRDDSPEGIKKAAEEAANANTATATPEAQQPPKDEAAQKAPSDANAVPNADAKAQANAAPPADAAAAKAENKN